MAITVNIRGVKCTCEEVGELEIIPLRSIFGSEEPPKGTKAHDEWREAILRRMESPATLKSLAYVVSSLFPDAPEKFVRYRFRVLPDGSEVAEVGKDIVFKLDAEELSDIVRAIAPLLAAKLQKTQKDRKHDLSEGQMKALAKGLAPMFESAWQKEEQAEFETSRGFAASTSNRKAKARR